MGGSIAGPLFLCPKKKSFEKVCVTKKVAYLYTMNNKQTPTAMQFETGKTYYSRKACLAGLPSGDFTVVKRNEKTLTIKVGAHMTRRNIVTNSEGVELVKYSGRATSLNVFADNR